MTKWEKKTQNHQKILQDAKLLEMLVSGLDKKTLQTLKDFRILLQLFWLKSC